MIETPPIPSKAICRRVEAIPQPALIEGQANSAMLPTQSTIVMSKIARSSMDRSRSSSVLDSPTDHPQSSLSHKVPVGS